jgi:hypothetical protein
MILALQCCPVDSAQALELTRLICDIEPVQRKDDEFCISVRRDTAPEHFHEMARLAAVKFSWVHVIINQRAGVGWPEGPNDLWAETMMRLSLMQRAGKTKQIAALTFEADCVPLRTDWINVLRRAWQETQDDLTKWVVGHAHGEPPDHINGNAIFRIGMLRKYPVLYNSDKRKGWDAAHGDLLLKLGRDTDAITQLYNLRDYDRELLEGVRKGGVVPALFHGTKGLDGVRIVREMLHDGTLETRAVGVPGTRDASTLKKPSTKATACAKTDGL